MEHNLIKILACCLLFLLTYAAEDKATVETNEINPFVVKERVKRNEILLEEIVLTNEEIASFVNDHNDYRRMQSATNMRLVSWDDEIAELAKGFAEQCRFEHSSGSERLTMAFPQLGENLYQTSTSSTNRNNTRSRMLSSIQAWYNEIEDYNYENATDPTSNCDSGKVCGHYTQVVWHNSYKLGCGAAFCDPTDARFNHRLLVWCNYGPPGNFIGQKPFELGEGCTACTDRTDICVNGLCANIDRGDNIPTTTSEASPSTTSTASPSTASTSTSTNAPTFSTTYTNFVSPPSSPLSDSTIPLSSSTTSNDTVSTSATEPSTPFATTPFSTIRPTTPTATVTTPSQNENLLAAWKEQLVQWRMALSEWKDLLENYNNDRCDL